MKAISSGPKISRLENSSKVSWVRRSSAAPSRIKPISLYSVQVPGSAAKMSRQAFVRAMESMPAFLGLVQSHVLAFLEQVMVSAACNGAHNVKQRLARWLLMMRDRHDGDDLPLTQDLLAEMLGVHRPSITNAAQSLQREGFIECGRRRVTILDRDGLVGASCECYGLVRTRIAHHLPKTFSEAH